MDKKHIGISALIVVLLAVGVWALARTESSNRMQNRAQSILTSKLAVKDIAENGFGELSQISTQGRSNLAAGGTGAGGMVEKLAVMGSGSMAPSGSSSSAPGMTVATTTATAPVVSNLDSSTTSSASGRMIAPGEPNPGNPEIPPYIPTQYVFSYKGASLPQIDSTQLVYRRQKNITVDDSVTRALRGLTLGLIDLSKFQNTQLLNFSLSEKVESGYIVNVDLMNGSVSMNQNWETWPQPAEYVPLKEEDMLSDQAAADIARKFLTERGVSLADYGALQVMDNWAIPYAKAENKSEFYFPEYMTLVFPFVLDGKSVVDSTGRASGMNVGIDIRSKRVANVYELSSLQFERSAYAGETDTTRILKVAEGGGYEYSAPVEGDVKQVDLELATPTIQMARVWNYDGYESEELFVPAFVFPIKDKKDYWAESVVVPLVKEVLDNTNTPQPIMPMPGPASSGSSDGDTMDQEATESASGGSGANYSNTTQGGGSLMQRDGTAAPGTGRGSNTGSMPASSDR